MPKVLPPGENSAIF